MIKKWLFALVAVSVLIGGLAYIKLGQFTAMGEAASAMQMPPQTVTATRVEKTRWERSIPATATVSAVQGVMVSAETAGRVTEIHFDSAAEVQAGDVLLQLDTSSEASQLAAANAAAELARAELARLRKLVKNKLASEDALDRARAQVKETVAQVGVIQAALDKKTVLAPFSGRLGIRQVNLGQIVSVGDAIVALQMLDPVYVDFSVPQQHFSQLEAGLPVRVTSDATHDNSYTGRITAVDLEIDPVTRNIHVRAEVNNPDEQLRTGMFVKLEVILPQQQEVMQVPATAVLFAPFGNSVFVIDEQADGDDGKATQVLRQQFITIGESRGDFVDVTDGLQDGETVVTSGVFKLSSGMQVEIDNSLAPQASLSPQPRDS